MEAIIKNDPEVTHDLIEKGQRIPGQIRKTLEGTVTPSVRARTIPTIFAVTNSPFFPTTPVGNLSYPPQTSPEARLYHLSNLMENRMVPLLDEFNNLGASTLSVPNLIAPSSQLSNPVAFGRNLKELKRKLATRILPFLDQEFPRAK